MKPNKDKWIDDNECELAIDFDNQTEFDNFNEYLEHQYTVFCDQYDDSKESGWN